LGEILRTRVIESPAFGRHYIDISGDLPGDPFSRAQIGSDLSANRSNRKTARLQSGFPRFFIPKLAANQGGTALDFRTRNLFLRRERSCHGVCNQQVENCLIIRAFTWSTFVVHAGSISRFGNCTLQICLINSLAPRQSQQMPAPAKNAEQIATTWQPTRPFAASYTGRSGGQHQKNKDASLHLRANSDK
jgi:hypothetical protein